VISPISLSKNKTFNQGSVLIEEALCSSIIFDLRKKWRVKAHNHSTPDFRELRFADSGEGG
jgi:hypothetical protein